MCGNQRVKGSNWQTTVLKVNSDTSIFSGSLRVKLNNFQRSEKAVQGCVILGGILALVRTVSQLG